MDSINKTSRKPGNISTPISYTEIKNYWNNNPCSGGDINFPFGMCKGKKVLEIGCGTGIDAERFVDSGAIYTGIDLTENAVFLARLRTKNKGMIVAMNAEFLDFPDNHFDLVYSFGVIHHSVDPERIIKEVYRVLKPRGTAAIMLYNKFSIRYIFDIMFIRKMLWMLHYPEYNRIRHKIRHPTKDQWISINTDNLGCPISRAYTKKEALGLFKQFKSLSTFTRNWGWFRKIVATK